ncbi:MAG TPA: hypothetical protein P5511_04140, partial [Candidatus Goldiibacteriota bacterium]|nr:hypothetical protein [Candidatus Goldiibacteriota bacterium]
SVWPLSASVGQNITLVMTVSNTGTGNALNVYPSDPVKVGTAGTAKSISPTASENINFGSAKYFTWVYSTSSAGTAHFSARAGGIDENNSKQIYSSYINSQQVSVETQAALTASFYSLPAFVSTGQTITLSMGVSNTGGADAVSAQPEEPGQSGAGMMTLLTSPSAVTIPGGGFAVFQWTYTASSAGNVVFTSRVNATDENLGSAVISNTASSGTVAIENAFSPLCSIYGPPSVSNDGLVYTVTMVVTNTGGAAGNSVTPHLSWSTVAGNAVIGPVSGPSPASTQINPSASAVFTWTYTANGSGTMQFTGFASGIDENTLQPVTVTAAAVNVIVQSPAPVLARPVIVASPAQVSIGQVITVIMRVTNNGLADALSVTPSVSAYLGNVLQTSGPVPAIADIPSNGGVRQFTWTYTAYGAGNAAFLGTASNGPYSSVEGQSNTITVQTIPVISSDYAAMASPISVGQQITVRLSVSNAGQATAANVIPYLTTIGDASSLSYVSGPLPASANIASGQTAVYTWVYNTTGAGTVSFYLEVSGQDANSGSPVDAEAITTSNILIQSPASLNASLLMPATVTYGQHYLIRMVVSNTGTAAANNVVPANPFRNLSSVGTSIRWDGPTPSSVNINGGSLAVFTWTYSASGTGNINYTSTASGTDANSGLVKTSNTASASVLVQQAVSLTTSITASPSTAKTGSQLTVVAQVSNATGSATAVNVSITPRDLGKILAGADTGAFVMPSPVSRTVAGGSSVSFTWLYSLGSGVGTLSFTGTAIGQDSNTGWFVQSGQALSNEVGVQASAVLA